MNTLSEATQPGSGSLAVAVMLRAESHPCRPTNLFEVLSPVTSAVLRDRVFEEV